MINPQIKRFIYRIVSILIDEIRDIFFMIGSVIETVYRTTAGQLLVKAANTFNVSVNSKLESDSQLLLIQLSSL